MKISILCRYPVIHEGIKAILRNKYEDITGFTSIEDCFKTLDSTENTSLNDTEDTIGGLYDFMRKSFNNHII